jgi:hypothetical protein
VAGYGEAWAVRTPVAPVTSLAQSLVEADPQVKPRVSRAMHSGTAICYSPPKRLSQNRKTLKLSRKMLAAIRGASSVLDRRNRLKS